MSLAPTNRKVFLTAHVVASVGWLGAVAGSLALAVTALASTDETVVRACWIALEATGLYVLLPLSFASLLTGTFQALRTRWGLLKHYWVVAKLVLNVSSSIVLLLYLQTLAYVADLARNPATGLADLRDPSPVLHATAAIVLLVGATVLSVFKPKGLTRHGRRVAAGRVSPEAGFVA